MAGLKAEDLREKVLQEYDKYKTIKMIEGKERIYGQADQVALTKKIKDIIIAMRFSGQELEVLISTNNLLDKLCLACSETGSISDRAIKRKINEFIKKF